MFRQFVSDYYYFVLVCLCSGLCSLMQPSSMTGPGWDEGMPGPSSVWLSAPFIFIYTYRTCTACCRTSISTCTHTGLKWVEVLVPVLLERKGEGQGSCLRQPGSHDARPGPFIKALTFCPLHSWLHLPCFLNNHGWKYRSGEHTNITKCLPKNEKYLRFIRNIHQIPCDIKKHYAHDWILEHFQL